MSTSSRFSLESNGDRTVDPETFSRIVGVTKSIEESGRYLLTVAEPHLSIPGCLDLLSKESLQLKSLTTRHVNLEDVFVNLTGRHLRDD